MEPYPYLQENLRDPVKFVELLAPELGRHLPQWQVELIQALVERGVEPVVLTSPHFADRPAEAEEQLQRVYKEFKRRKRMIFGRD